MSSVGFRGLLLAGLLLAGCGGSSGPGAIEQEAQTARSWVATARLAGESWQRGAVPTAYARQTVATARQELGQSSRQLEEMAAADAAEQRRAALLQELSRVDGTLDGLATKRGQKQTTFTLSGYGLTEANPAHEVSPRERLMATSKLTNLRSALTDGYSVRLGGNGNDKGGVCFGDSGGPVFYGGFSSNTIVALSGWFLGPRQVCTGNGYYYRTDRQAVIDWILETVPESEASEIDIVEL
jgi:hypothetical protein